MKRRGRDRRDRAKKGVKEREVHKRGEEEICKR